MGMFILGFIGIYYLFDKSAILGFLGLILAIFLPFDLLNYFSKGKNRFSKLFFRLYPKKSEEKNRLLSDASTFFISTILLILIFEREIVLFTLILFALCDASEGVFGKLISSKTLPWNKRKNFAGTLGGFIIAMISGYLAVTYLSIDIPMLLILPASFICALAGTVKKWDNLFMPWLTAIVTWFLIMI